MWFVPSRIFIYDQQDILNTGLYKIDKKEEEEDNSGLLGGKGGFQIRL